jgi:tyrosine-protein kinase Etk/Wzc
MGLEYARRLRDLKYHELVFEFLAKQLEVARIDEAREGAIIQVVDRAERPDQKSWPKMSLVLPVAFGFGLVLSVLVALAFYSWSGMKNSGRSAKIEDLRRLWIS